MVSTIASLIRDNGNAIRALATSMNADGQKYLYKDLLVALGLPASSAHISAVSKFLNKEGIRRRAAFSRPKSSDSPEIPALHEDETVECPTAPDTPERDPVTALLADCGKLNDIARSLNQISEAMRAVAEAVGLHIMIETYHATDTDDRS